jgi:hypothetical protein
VGFPPDAPIFTFSGISRSSSGAFFVTDGKAQGSLTLPVFLDASGVRVFALCPAGQDEVLMSVRWSNIGLQESASGSLTSMDRDLSKAFFRL